MQNNIHPDIDPKSVSIEDEPQPQPSPPADFQVGDVCIIRESVKRKYGTIPKGQIVEIIRRFPKNKVLHYDITTLPCKSCGLIIKVFDVSLELLQNYDEVFSPTI